jgi:hypothetical protein
MKVSVQSHVTGFPFRLENDNREVLRSDASQTRDERMTKGE